MYTEWDESRKNVEMSHGEKKLQFAVLKLVVILVHAENPLNVKTMGNFQRLAPNGSGESLKVKPQANGGRKIQLLI